MKTKYDPKASSWIDVLYQTAETDAQVHLIDERGGKDRRSWSQILHHAQQAAVGLRRQGVETDDIVLIISNTSFDQIVAYFAVMLMGAAPLILWPPREDEDASAVEEVLRIADTVEARAVIYQTEIPESLRAVAYGALEIITDLPELSQGVPLQIDRVTFEFERDIASIQMTSGTTSPRPVVLSHENMLSNVQAVGEWLEVTDEDVGVSWLPMHNIMGLVGVVLFGLYWAIDLVLIDPKRFMKRPEVWLWAIHENKGTLSPAPNFAYDWTVRRCQRSELKGLDLSSWRVAMNGGEPVRADHMEQFTRRFSEFGLQESIFLPVYGLSEATLALTFAPLGQPILLDHVDREDVFLHGRATPIRPDRPMRERRIFVSSGRPLSGVEVEVRDDHGVRCDDRIIGEIAARGPNIMTGYLRSPESPDTSATRLHSSGWLCTGDMGYMADGNLFVVGRRDDAIALASGQLYPEELEEIVADVDGVRNPSVALFGVTNSELCRLILALEVQPGADEEELEAEIRERLGQTGDFKIDEIRFLPPHSIPKCASGKVRRQRARELYLAGTLGQHERGHPLIHLISRARQGMLRAANQLMGRRKKP